MFNFQISQSKTASWMSWGFLALILMVALSVGAFFYQQKSSVGVRHTIEVDRQLWEILSSLQDAETGQRGYLLTGADQYLEPYRASVEASKRSLNYLTSLVRLDPFQKANEQRVEQLAAAKYAELGATIELRRRGDGARALALVETGQGKAVMDEIRGLIDSMHARQVDRLTGQERTAALIGVAIWSLLVLLAVLLFVLAFAAVREAGRRASLSRFLPEELSTRLADDGDALHAGRRQPAAVCFVDIRGSTALAEHLDPAELSVFLSSFRRRVMRIARLHGGVVDKFIGDGALIVFGLPEPKADDAARGLLFAGDIVAVIARWNTLKPTGPEVTIGVGIHFGEVFCGIIGEESRREFTVLGDTVNVASRLESATKTYGVPILASEAVWRAAGADSAGWREVTRTPLRGRRDVMLCLTPTELRLHSPAHEAALVALASEEQPA